MTRGGGLRRAVAVLLTAVLLLGGCSVWHGVARVATFPGVEAAAVLRALQGDPTLTVTDLHIEPRWGAGQFRCERGAMSADVHLSADLDRIEVRSAPLQRAGSDPEIREWTVFVESICARLDAEVPGIGPWEAADSFGGPLEGHAGAAFATYAGLLALLFGIQYVQVRRRRRAARPAGS